MKKVVALKTMPFVYFGVALLALLRFEVVASIAQQPLREEPLSTVRVSILETKAIRTKIGDLELFLQPRMGPVPYRNSRGYSSGRVQVMDKVGIEVRRVSDFLSVSTPLLAYVPVNSSETLTLDINDSLRYRLEIRTSLRTVIPPSFNSVEVVISGVAEWKKWDLSPADQISSSFPRSTPTAPTVLSAKLSFLEPSGNNYLDAEETANLIVTLTNSGKGDAQDIQMKIIPQSDASGIRIGTVPPIDRILAGETRTVQVPISADKGVASKEIKFKIEVHEANGFDLDPSIPGTINTKSFDPPELTIADVGLNDTSGNGQIEPRSYPINTCKRLWSKGIAFSALQKGPYSLAFRKGAPRHFLIDASFHPFMR